MGLAEVRRIFNTKPLTSLATCYISYPLPGKFWGIFGNLPAALLIRNWLLLKTGCFYSASPDWWLWAGKHSNGWHSIKLSYKKNYCINIAKGTSECKMARCYYLECARCIHTKHVLMHGSCLAYQSRPPRQGKWCCHQWLCSLDVDTSAFFRKLLTELSATLLSRKLLFEMAHTHRVCDGSDDCTLPPLAVPDPSPFCSCRNFLPKFSHTILLTPLIRAFLFFAVKRNDAPFIFRYLIWYLRF